MPWTRDEETGYQLYQYEQDDLVSLKSIQGDVPLQSLIDSKFNEDGAIVSFTMGQETLDEIIEDLAGGLTRQHSWNDDGGDRFDHWDESDEEEGKEEGGVAAARSAAAAAAAAAVAAAGDSDGGSSRSRNGRMDYAGLAGKKTRKKRERSSGGGSGSGSGVGGVGGVGGK